MSRIGKNPVNVPKEVKVTLNNGSVHLEGPKGKLDLKLPEFVRVELKDNQLTVTRTSDEKQARANHGTIRARLANMIDGLVRGHKKELEIQGIGFRAALQGNKIAFILGFSHPVEFEVPSDVKIAVPTQTNISIEGPDSQRVGQVAASIRALKPVEPYKGKGVRYVNEVVRRKQGKSVTK